MPSMTPAIMDSHGNPAMAGTIIALDVLTCEGLVTIVDEKAVMGVVAVVNSVVTTMIVVYELVIGVRTPFDVEVDVFDSSRVMFDNMVVVIGYEFVEVLVPEVDVLTSEVEVLVPEVDVLTSEIEVLSSETRGLYCSMRLFIIEYIVAPS